MKIALIYNDARKDTTGFYVGRALRSLKHEVTYVNPFKTLIPSGHDLYLLVDDGADYALLGKEGKLAYWAIDTHFSPEQCLKKAKYANWVFTAQKNGIDVLPGSHWLPLGCDTGIHIANNFEKKYDVCFIGNAYPGSMDKRIDYLDVLFKNFPNFYYGNKFFNEASNIYGQSRLVFNCSLKNDINMRVFEAMCSGSLLITDKIKDNGFEDLGFIDGENCVVYDSPKELVEKTKFYIATENERERVIKNAAELARNKHTYEERVKEMLKIIGGYNEKIV